MQKEIDTDREYNKIIQYLIIPNAFFVFPRYGLYKSISDPIVIRLFIMLIK